MLVEETAVLFSHYLMKTLPHESSEGTLGTSNPSEIS